MGSWRYQLDAVMTSSLSVAILSHLGAILGYLGPFWGDLGQSLGHLGAIWGGLGAILAARKWRFGSGGVQKIRSSRC